MAADALPPSAALIASPEKTNGVKLNPALEEREEDDFQKGRPPLKYIALCDVYSATSPCVTATGSKKVKAAARKPPQVDGHDQLNYAHPDEKPEFNQVYSRRRKRTEEMPPFMESMFLQGLDETSEELEVDAGMDTWIKRRRKGSHTESVKLGVGCKSSSKLDDQTRLSDRSDKINCNTVRKNRNFNSIVNNGESRKRKNVCLETDIKDSEAAQIKKWVWVSFEGADPKNFIGLQCKVYWPLDARWYSGHIVGYNSETERHHVKYEDGENENLVLSNERIKFYLSLEDMRNLKLKFRDKSSEPDGIDVNELMVLAANLDDCQEKIATGDIIWAKLTGHAVWPAIVLDDSHARDCKGLNKISGEKSVLVQFFGTHDFARVARKQVISFLKGLLESCHSKCKKPMFVRGLEEAKMYLSELRLPKRMLQLRDGVHADMNNSQGEDHQDGADSGDEESMNHDEISKKIDDLKSCPLEEGELQIISLGKIVKDSGNFQNERFIFPEGYTAVRMFPSITDPSVHMLYKMEVLRDVASMIRPLFRVTTDNGEEFDGPTPSACWNKIYKRIRSVQIRNRDYKADQNFAAGSSMFGFSHPKVSKLIKEMSNSQQSSKSSQLTSGKNKKPDPEKRIRIEWRDLDKCNVCYMDEEYENNLFLQCDKCRMMVHAKCYGEIEPADDVLWLCQLCRPGAPESPLKCCLCPVVGGAMKPTTDGNWAHLACAIWIPETCLSDIKKMEPIDGVSRIKKDRWRLLCSICEIPHGACIQCSNYNCYVAYHPLCARVSGLCLEPEDIDRLHLPPSDDDDEDQCIQLFSFCKKHSPTSSEPLPSEERTVQKACEPADYIPPINPRGCARCEPYNFDQRRGRNEPEAPAASSKRLYVENQPYLIGGCSPRMPLWNKMASSEPGGYKYSSVHLLKLQESQLDPPGRILSLFDKYNHMKNTYKKRLAFGKSGIHGFGVFAKFPIRAGDMLIEYTGEIIRQSVADRREHLIYNKLVGAGTYMFRIDDERVIDATRAGSIASLINHSCEPNCYSRVMRIKGEDHIIIFAKRDINQWEELTYDYRFLSFDERLVCHCGSSRCRGVVNDVEAEERVKKRYVPRSELRDWKGE